MYVLYVGRDRDAPDEYCPGSNVCMALAEKLGDPSALTVQDCSILRRTKPLPDWLNGTPILIDRNDPTQPLRGSDAVRALEGLVRAGERRSGRAPPQPHAEDGDDDRPPPPRRTVGGPLTRAPPRMQGQMTRQPAPKAATRHQPPPPPQQHQPLASSHEHVEPPDAHSPYGDEDDDQLLDTMANGAGNATISDGKVTDQDLQKYMELRNASVASQSTTQMPAQPP